MHGGFFIAQKEKQHSVFERCKSFNLYFFVPKGFNTRRLVDFLEQLVFTMNRTIRYNKSLECALLVMGYKMEHCFLRNNLV